MKNSFIMAILASFVLVGTAYCGPKNKKEEKQCDIPTPDKPVLAIGDSMMRLLGREMEKAFKKADIQPMVSFSSLGSGLVRPSAFNWTQKIDELVATNHPKTVFVCLGANDRQAIEADGIVIPYENAEAWRAAYSKCIGGVMDQLISKKVERIVWLLLPPMRDPVNEEHAKLVTEVVTEQAATEERKDYVALYSIGRVLSPKDPTKYKPTRFVGSSTQPFQVRDPDGVHLTAAGGKIVAEAILSEFWDKDVSKIK